jgi:uncharacterized protein (TIGR02722 family)
MKTNVLSAILPLLLCAGCGSPVVTYEDEKRPIAIENKFSVNDVSKFAEGAVQKLLSREKLDGSERPMVFLAGIQNDSSEHIDTQAIADVMQEKLLDSGKFRFTAGAQGQKYITEQIDWQSSAALPDTAVKAGRQLGARYVMYGRLTDFTQKSDAKMSKDYQFTLRVANIETAEVLVNSTDRIRKVTTN